MLNVVTLYVSKLNVAMLSVIILIVVEPSENSFQINLISQFPCLSLPSKDKIEF